MRYEYLHALEITYDNALVVGGDYHRVTTPNGIAAEIAPKTYLWYKYACHQDIPGSKADIKADASSTTESECKNNPPTPSNSERHPADGITALYVGSTNPLSARTTERNVYWVKLEKAIDPINGVYLWYRRHSFAEIQSWHLELSKASKEDLKAYDTISDKLPIKEIYIVHDTKQLSTTRLQFLPIFDTHAEALEKDKDLTSFQSYLCYHRMSVEDCNSSNWTLQNQEIGIWIDVYDQNTSKWQIGQIVHKSANQVRISISSWGAKRPQEQVLTLYPVTGTKKSMYGSRVTNRTAKLGTHTFIQLAPTYPTMRKQGSVWDLRNGISGIQLTQQEMENRFFRHFRELSSQNEKSDLKFEQSSFSTTKMYLAKVLLPFVEKSLVSQYTSVDLIPAMHQLHQQVLQKSTPLLLLLSTYFQSNNLDAASHQSPSSGETTERMRNLKSIQQLLFCLIRILLNGHESCAYFYAKYSEADSIVHTFGNSLKSSRHPTRSSYYIALVDLFLQHRGPPLLLHRVAEDSVTLDEIALHLLILENMKPRLQKLTHSGEESTPSTFLCQYRHAIYCRLSRLSALEIRDEMELIHYLLKKLQVVYADDELFRVDDNVRDADALTDTTKRMELFRRDAEERLPFTAIHELFELELAKQLICCPFLQQRLSGLSCLTEIVNAAALKRDSLGQKRQSLSRKVSSSSDLSRSNSEQSDAISVRNRIVGEWLTHSQVLEVILGDPGACKQHGLRQDGGHLEIMKRARTLLETIGSLDLLTEAHLVLLWRTAVGQLRTDRKFLLQMILSVVESAGNADLLDIVAVLLTQIPVNEYDDITVQFLVQVIVYASRQTIDMEVGQKRSYSLMPARYNKLKSSVQAIQKEMETLNKVISLCCSLLWNCVMQQAQEMYRNSSLERFGRDCRAAFATILCYLHRIWVSPTLQITGTLADLSKTAAKEQQQLVFEYVMEAVECVQQSREVVTVLSVLHGMLEANTADFDAFAPLWNERDASAKISQRLYAIVIAQTSKPNDPQTFSSISVHSRDTESNVVAGFLMKKSGLMDAVWKELERFIAAAEYVDVAFHIRLWYLGYFIQKLGVKNIQFSSISGIWDLIRSSEKQVFLSWLYHMLPSSIPSEFNDLFLSSDTISHFFHTLNAQLTSNSTLDVENVWFSSLDISVCGFWVFERLFRLVHAKRLRGTETAFQVETLDLQGLESLFAVAQNAIDDDVCVLACKYLIYLHTHTGSKLVRREVWQEFVQNCMNRLERCCETLDAEDRPIRPIDRLLRMLATFLSHCTAHGTDQTTDSNASTEEIHVHVKTQEGREAAPWRYHVRKSTLVSSLRDRIAADITHSGDRIRLVNALGTTLTAMGHDKCSLEAARVFPVAGEHGKKAVIQAIVLRRTEYDTTGHTTRPLTRDIVSANAGKRTRQSTGLGRSEWEKDVWAAKSTILHTSSWMELLLKLLSFSNDSISEQAWKVLSLLPPCETMEKRLHTLNYSLGIDGNIELFPTQFDWNSLLDVETPPLLLYQLEMVEVFAFQKLENNDNASDTLEDKFSQLETHTGVQVISQGQRNAWTISFLKLGGRRHLETFLLRLNAKGIATASLLTLLCVSKLCKLLRHFVMAEEAFMDEKGRFADHVASLLSSFPTHETEESPRRTSSIHSPLEEALLSTEPKLTDYDNVYAESMGVFATLRMISLLAAYLKHTKEVAMDTVLELFLDSKHVFIRTHAARLILSVSLEHRDALYALKMLTILSEYDRPIRYREYYTVYAILIEKIPDLKEFAFLPACERLFSRLKSMEIPSSTCEAFDHNDNDTMLEALLHTILVVYRHIPAMLAGRWDVPYRGRSLREVVSATLDDNGVTSDLFHQCLFSFGGNRSREPKCRTQNARGMAFDLLLEMCLENSIGLQRVLSFLNAQHTLTDTRGTMTRWRRKKVKSKPEHPHARYVGLKNLGCTCYLNATMQAFFMMPRFRKAVLCLESSEKGSKRLVVELQSLFAHLQSLAKPYYSPKAFIDALHSWDGESIDVMEQQDASEFLTLFFQQMEAEMNGSLHGSTGRNSMEARLLDRFFGGMYSNELVAQGDRYSERLEPFHFLSVPVRDRKTLTEALTSLFEGDVVEYTWEDKRKEHVTLDTMKRLSICRLPEILIIHLKRFEYDLERGMRIKVHDRLEFPMILDMYPFTKHGQNAQRATLDVHEALEYEFRGTVVHMGTAHSGHYYSILREESEQWYEFNDTIVSPFDASQLANECFGNSDSQSVKKRSSFMLFYTRTSGSVGSETALFPRRIGVIAYVALFCVRLRRKGWSNIEYLRRMSLKALPLKISQQIQAENELFWLKKYIWDTTYLQFTFRLLRNCLMDTTGAPVSDALLQSTTQTFRFEPVEARFVALQVATKFVFGTLHQSGDVTLMLGWRPVLEALYYEETEGCEWFLKALLEHKRLVLELLIAHPNVQVRELMFVALREAIMTATRILPSVDPSLKSSVSYGIALYQNGGEQIQLERSEASAQLPLSFEFVYALLKLMPWLLTVPVEYHRYYLTLLLHFISAGRNECMFVVVNNGIGAIISLLSGGSHAHVLLASEFEQSKARHMSKSLALNEILLKLLSLLLRCCEPPAMDSSVRVLPPNLMQDHVQVSSSDKDILLQTDRWCVLLIQHATQYGRETKPLEQIVMHLCWESRQMTSRFMERIMDGIETQDDQDIKPYFRTMNVMYKVRDSLATERIQDGMTRLIAVLASQQRYYRATEIAIDMLTRLAKRHSRVMRWLRENRSSCLWMTKWLRGHRGANGYLQQHQTTLVKPNSTSPWSTVNVSNRGLVKSVERAISRLLPRLEGVLDPAMRMEYFYDSDDNPERLVGKRVRVKWAKDKWYEGRVERFDDATYEHFVVYDDGDKRNYRMSDKIFYIVESDKSLPSSISASRP